MKNKKVLALLVSLVLIVAVALPGTLAVSSDQDAVNSGFTVDTASPAPETPEQPVDPENPEQPETPEQPEQPVVPETQEITGEPQTPAEVPACTCEPQPAEGEAHKEGCPLAPLSCTCDPAPLEGEAHKEGCPLTCTCVSQPLTGTIHKEGCPLYVAPLTCTRDPQPAEGEPHAETCPLYVAPELTLVERLLATKTLEEYMSIVEGATEEELTLSDDDYNLIDAQYIYLTTGEYPSFDPVVYTVIETVNYTCVAAFGAPVSGGQG